MGVVYLARSVSGRRLAVEAGSTYRAGTSARTSASRAPAPAEATRPGRDDGGTTESHFAASGVPLVLVGDALYVPWGVRSVYTVDVGNL